MRRRARYHRLRRPVVRRPVVRRSTVVYSAFGRQAKVVLRCWDLASVAHWPDCAFSGISSIDEVHQRAFEVVRGSSVGQVANLETSLVPQEIVHAGTDVGQQQIAPV